MRAPQPVCTIRNDGCVFQLAVNSGRTMGPRFPIIHTTLIRRALPAVLLLAVATLNAGGSLHGQPSRPAASLGWTDYAGGPDSSKFVDMTEIRRENVGTLRPAWTYEIGDENVYQFNPIVVDSTMYVLAKNSSLVALDALTGKERWIHAGLRGIARRGINYWESADRDDRRLIFQINDYLQAIDATTGKSILSFGRNGLVDLRDGVGRDPARIGRVQSATPGRIFENLLLLGSAPGEEYLSAPGTLRAFDVITGKLVWAFHTVPQPGEQGYETWPKEAWRYTGGANTWGEITVDTRRGIAYFPTGSPTYDYYGADRVGANLYANCLLALDARTGKRLWHFRSCTTICGTTTWPRHRSSSRCAARTARRSTRSPRPPNTGFCSCSIGSRGNRSGRSRSGPFPRATCPARCRGPHSHFRRSLCPLRVRRWPNRI
jgi:hypothetical protein